jgi:hypothetical protein
MNIITAIHDKHLFRKFFKDLDTWRAWQVFLKATFALPMDQEDLTLYRTCTGRQNPPDKPSGEAWAPYRPPEREEPYSGSGGRLLGLLQGL